MILPGLGNNKKDYEPLAKAIRERGLLVDTAKIARLDWGRNAAGLLDLAYYRGTLQPRPVVDWYSPPALGKALLCTSAARPAANRLCYILRPSPAPHRQQRAQAAHHPCKDAQIASTDTCCLPATPPCTVLSRLPQPVSPA